MGYHADACFVSHSNVAVLISLIASLFLCCAMINEELLAALLIMTGYGIIVSNSIVLLDNFASKL